MILFKGKMGWFIIQVTCLEADPIVIAGVNEASDRVIAAQSDSSILQTWQH